MSNPPKGFDREITQDELDDCSGQGAPVRKVSVPDRSPEGWPSAAQLEAMQALVSDRVPFRVNERGEIQVEIGKSFFDATKEGTTFDDD